MAKLEAEIKQEIKNHMQECGGSYSDWYVGISSDPRKRLFEEHKVREKGDAWIYRQAYNNESARNVEQYFINVLGTDGGSGGGDESSVYVYAYKKNNHTEP